MGSSLALDGRVYGSNILWGREGARAGKWGIDSSLNGGGELRHGGRGDGREGARARAKWEEGKAQHDNRKSEGGQDDSFFPR